jgi:PAS domain S-box-containing protein
MTLTESDVHKIKHELEVYQIELELQHEELINAQGQAKAAIDKYSELYDFAPTGYYTISREGEISELNLIGAKMLGKDRSQLKNTKLSNCVSEDTKSEFKLFLERVFASKTSQTCEAALSTNDPFPVYLHFTGIASENGKQCFATAVDISDLKNSEASLSKSEARYRQLAENSTSIVYRLLLKPELKFDYVSPSATEITGYTPEDHYADPQLGFKLVHPDDRKLLENTAKYSKGEPLELRWIRKDGREIWTEQRNVLLYDESNEPYAIEGNARDVTDRKYVELRFKKEAERTSLLLDLFTKAPALADIDLYNQSLDIAVKITESKIGFFHQVSDNEQEIILTSWTEATREGCFAVYDNHYPIGKAGNWADAVRQKKAVVYNDFPASPNKKGLPEGHAPIIRTLSIPVIHEGKVRLIFGVGNKSSDYSDFDVIQIQAVANELYKILEKRQVEQTLKKSEDRWQFAIEGSNEGIWDWNLISGEVFYSNRWKEMLGYNPHELEGKLHEWQNRVHPDDVNEVMSKLQQHLGQKTSDYLTEHRIKCKDGSWKWILDRGRVLEWTVDGKPSRMVGTHSDITERKKADEIIRKSEEKFRIVADNAFNWEFWEGPDGKAIHHSPSCKSITGYSADEFMNDDDLLVKIIHADDKESFLKHRIEKKADQTPGTHNFRILAKNGEIHHVEHLCRPVFDDAGSLIGIRGSHIDITQRMLAEEKVRESEVQFRNLANSGSALIWTAGNDKLCNYFNDTWLKFTGRTLEQELGNGWTEGVHPDDFNNCLDTYLIAFDKQVPFEMVYRLRHISGDYRWIVDLGTPNYNSSGAFIGYIGHCFDITERKIMEDAQTFLLGCGLPGTKEDFFHSLARYLSKTLDMEYVCIDRLEGDGLIAQTVAIYNEGIFESNARYELKDTPCGEVIDRSVCLYKFGVRHLFPKDAALQDLNAESYVGTTLFDSKGRAIGLIAVIGHKPLHDGGKAQGLLNLVASRTAGELERRQAENALKETLQELYKAKEMAEESDRLKSAFLANMSHEIRTPMNGILGFSNLLGEPNIDQQEQKKFIEIIQKSGVRMMNIINEIIDISKIESGIVETKIWEVNIKEQIEGIFYLLEPEAKGKKIKISISLPPLIKEPKIKTDGEKLDAILLNLLKNAIKYTDEGSIEIGYNAKAGAVEFFVKDTGIGIQKDRQEAIFERFIQADIADVEARQGAGLGLSIAKAYVEMLGGKIWVESEPGKGSTFYFTLPQNNI